MKKAFYPFVLSLLLSSGSFAQLHISTDVPPDTMMMDFFNTGCATVSNVSSNEGSIAFFEGAMTNLGLNAGIYLSTGDVFTANEVNIAEGTSGSSGSGGDYDLLAISTANIIEHSMIEMDLVANTDVLSFKYVFASEEYCEWVNSQFNDVFGFFISGPGISGPYSNGAINIAMLDPSTPVAINTVNHLMNPEYFVGSNGSCNGAATDPYHSFDGTTVVMDAMVNLVPGETYHVRIGVGDTGDGIFDSGVFIGIESLCGDSLLTPPSQFSVSLDENGILEIENDSKYATSYLWDFGDGTTSIEKDPSGHVYDFSMQSSYTLSLTTQNYCCSDTYSMIITEAGAAPTASFSSVEQEICAGEAIQFTDLSQGDVETWVWNFPGGYPEMSTEQAPLISYTDAGSYDVELTVTNAIGSNTYSQTAFINVLPAPVADFSALNIGAGEFEFTSLSENATSWHWDFGQGGVTSNEENPTYIYPITGTFTVTLTVENNCGNSIFSDEVQIVVDGTSDLYVLNDAQLIPNPAKDYFVIRGIQQTVFIEAYNLIGQLVHSQLLKSGEVVDVKNWPKGSYLINITSSDSASLRAIKKIIIK